METSFQKKLKKVIHNPELIPYGIFMTLFSGSPLPDRHYLKILYFLKTGKILNLKNPKTFNEKSQWLKLYDRQPEYQIMVDKYEVRKYISQTIGKEHLIPIYGVWDLFDEIPFDTLPDQFVLKCTHDSASVTICNNKRSFDMAGARKHFTKCLRQNYYNLSKEWAYKCVRPRIIAEKLMIDESGTELKDYKILCFNGSPDNIMVCLGRNTGTTQYYFFDFAWNLLRLNGWGKKAPENFTLPKPKSLEKMKEIATILSKNTYLTRIDLYDINGFNYFGEITFFPQGGYDTKLLPETNILFGNKIILPFD